MRGKSFGALYEEEFRAVSISHLHAPGSRWHLHWKEVARQLKADGDRALEQQRHRSWEKRT